MPDDFDRASDLEQQQRELALRQARGQPTMPAVGACYNCGEDLPPGRLFCDKDCRDDFEKRAGRKQ